MFRSFWYDVEAVTNSSLIHAFWVETVWRTFSVAPATVKFSIGLEMLAGCILATCASAAFSRASTSGRLGRYILPPGRNRSAYFPQRPSVIPCEVSGYPLLS